MAAKASDVRHGRDGSALRRQPAEVVAAVRAVAGRVCNAHGLLLWDIGFVREAGRETLRVACDRTGGVVSDELAVVAEDLSRELDHADAVPGEQRYILEVTSPGAERRLEGAEQFRVCTGRRANVTLAGGRTVLGTIGEVTDRAVTLETADGSVLTLFDDIGRARLVIEGFGAAT
ncbi:MAG: hypothetical protein WD646_14405 [Actinomycetota bacterium]